MDYRSLLRSLSKPVPRIPIDEDTRILYRKVIQVGDREAVFERWFSEGLKGFSIIFEKSQVSSSDEALALIKQEAIFRDFLRREPGSTSFRGDYLFFNWISDC